jgi:superfamily II DNA/RNA helicase
MQEESKNLNENNDSHTDKSEYFFRLTGSAVASDLASKLKLTEPFPVGEEFFSQCYSGRDSVFINPNETVFPALIGTFLASVKERDSRRRVAIVVADTTEPGEIRNILKKGGLTCDPVTDIELTGSGYTGDVIVGTPQETHLFFQSEASRATDIGKVIIVGITPEMRVTLDAVLEIASKRAKRPQFISMTSSRSSEVEALTVRYFQLPRDSLTHVQFELEGDVLAKPNALAALLESEGRCPTLVFCNQPSDADFIEVLLKKAGLTATKLIGNAPASKVQQALSRVLSGQTVALIATDVAARLIDPHEFELIVNYSIPSDPEIYIHRTESSGTGQSLRKIVNLVGPLDRANFHYIKKVVEANFIEGNLPPAEAVLGARVGQLRKRALEAAPLISSELQKIAELVDQGGSRTEIIAYLLSLEVEHSETSQQFRSSEDDISHDRNRDRDQRSGSGAGAGRRDRDRNSGGSNDRGREGRGDGHSQSRGRDRTNRRHDSNDRDSSDRFDNYSDRDQLRGERGSQARDNEENQKKPEPVPTVSIARLYVESSGSSKLSEAQLREAINSVDPELNKNIIRVSSRQNYTFLDVLESTTDRIQTILEQTKFGKNESLGVLKALSLSVPTDRPSEDKEVSQSNSNLTDTNSDISDNDNKEAQDSQPQGSPSVVDFDEIAHA